MSLEVILKKDVADLGEEGDICKVARGYARNYLLPFGFVVLKTAKNLEILKREKDQIEAKKREKLEKFKDIAQAIEELELEFWLRASKTGRLFGSITSTNLHQELEAKGFSQIKKNQIQLPQSIKSLGEYSIPIKIYGTLMAHLKIRLQDQSEKEETEQASRKASHQVSHQVSHKEEESTQESSITDLAIESSGDRDPEAVQGVEETVQEEAVEEAVKVEETVKEEMAIEKPAEEEGMEEVEEGIEKAGVERSEEEKRMSGSKGEDAEKSNEAKNL